MLRPSYRHLFAVLAALIAVYFGVRTSRAVVANQALAAQLQTEREQVYNLEEQNTALHAQVAYEQTPAFVEKVARQQLGLMRPGDHVIQLQSAAAPVPTSAPPATPPAVASPSAPRVVPTPKPATSPAPMVQPNWQRWLHLFVNPPEPAGLH